MIETKRLYLRRAKEADMQALFVIRNSEYVLQYNVMKTTTLEEFVKQITADKGAICLVRKEDNAAIGMVFIEEDSLRYGVASKGLSYYLGKQYAKQGYMKEALSATIDYLIKHEKLACIGVRVFYPNTASIYLLKSLGFHQEGIIRRCVKAYRDVVYDDVIFSMFQEEWLARPKDEAISL